MRFPSAVVLAAALTCGTSAAAAQQRQPVPIKEEEPGLAARAKIPADSARALARAAVPLGRIVAAELEEEDGQLIYSFDVKVDTEDGIFEVHVDAVTGKVGPVEHETGEGAEHLIGFPEQAKRY